MKALSILSLLAALCTIPVRAESQRAGDFELLYSVVNSTFVAPEIATRYRLVRARDRAFLNLAVRELTEDGGDRAVSATFQGRTWDLFQNQFLQFREIREGEAIYYIAEFTFENGETRFFDLDWAARDMRRSKTLRFHQKVYEE